MFGGLLERGRKIGRYKFGAYKLRVRLPHLLREATCTLALWLFVLHAAIYYIVDSYVREVMHHVLETLWCPSLG